MKMMCTQGFKGCLSCGCEMDSGKGTCLMCGQPLNHRSLLRIIITDLKARAARSIGPVTARDRETLSESRLVA